MKDLLEIRKFIEENSRKTDMALCTLIRKSGSAYRGIGSKKIIPRRGASIGLLSGGCLEGAIEQTARERFDGMPFVASFSTLAEEDRLMGYQTGCQGAIEILFEKIPARGVNEDIWRRQIDLMVPFGAHIRHAGVAVKTAGEGIGFREFVDSRDIPEGFVFEPWIEPVHVVIVGCGADADAYLPLLQSLGWTFQFIDYRSGLTRENRFIGVKAEHVPLAEIPEHIPRGKSVAVLLMTHNYEADMEILRGLNHHRLGYVGCLGPERRYERMKADLRNIYGETLSEELQSVIAAPIGLFIHSGSPEAIALSAVAQIQNKLVESARESVWTMILAAGASSRFGGVKALAEWQGQSFISKALRTAKTFSGSSTLVVTGGHAESIVPHISGAETIFNEKWEEGMGTSIAKGVNAILEKDPQAGYVVILPVDQPLVDSKHLENLVRASQKSGRCVLTAGKDFTGPPAVIPKNYFKNAQGLHGDRGLKSVLESVDVITIEEISAARDIDTPAELS